MKKALIIIEFTLLGLVPFISCYPFATLWHKQAPAIIVIGLQTLVHYLWGRCINRKLKLKTGNLTYFATSIGMIIPLVFFLGHYDDGLSMYHLMYGYVLYQLVANFLLSFYIIHRIKKENNDTIE